MKLKDLGEDGFVERLKHYFSRIGDDCAVLDSFSGSLLFTADMLVEGTHFAIPPFRYSWVGSKAILSNISDIVAMGGHPKYATVSLGVAADVQISELEQFFASVKRYAQKYNCEVVGGDLCRSCDFTVSISVIGVAPSDRVAMRCGARPGDILCVTGFPGTSAIGLEAILKGYPFELFEPFVERHVRPLLRYDFSVRVVSEGLVSSMIDVSDGLLLDLERLARESGVGFEILEDALPLPTCNEEQKAFLEKDLFYYALNGGEEYELLMTVPKRHLGRVSEIAGETNTPFHVIGAATEEKGIYLIKKGKKEAVKFCGFSHFGRRRNG